MNTSNSLKNRTAWECALAVVRRALAFHHSENAALLFFVAGVLVTSSVGAQPFTPPTGWEYVKSFDSVGISSLHVWKDTVIVTGHNERNDSFYIYSSTNKGNSWDSFPQLVTHYFPKSSGMMGWNGTSFEVTYDLGKNYLSFPDTSIRLPDIVEVVPNPFDAADVISVAEEQNGPDKYDEVFRSRDGGRSWAKIASGAGRFNVMFDLRQPGLWYVNGTGGTYRTDDNGITFSSIGDCWGDYCGIAASGVFRRWTTLVPPDVVVGVEDVKAVAGQGDTTFNNWIERMDALLPGYDKGTGYRHCLNASGYSFDENDVSRAEISNVLSIWNPNTDSISTLRVWAYRTTNDGQSWELVWDDPHPVWWTAISEGDSTEYSWIISLDSVGLFYNTNVLPHFSLWRRTQRLSVVAEANAETASQTAVVSIFPNPAIDRLAIRYAQRETTPMRLSLCNSNGNVLHQFSGKDDSSGVLEFEIPKSLPSGTYWIRAAMLGRVFSTPFLICK